MTPPARVDVAGRARNAIQSMRARGINDAMFIAAGEWCWLCEVVLAAADRVKHGHSVSCSANVGLVCTCGQDALAKALGRE